MVPEPAPNLPPSGSSPLLRAYFLGLRSNALAICSGVLSVGGIIGGLGTSSSILSDAIHDFAKLLPHRTQNRSLSIKTLLNQTDVALSAFRVRFERANPLIKPGHDFRNRPLPGVYDWLCLLCHARSSFSEIGVGLVAIGSPSCRVVAGSSGSIASPCAPLRPNALARRCVSLLGVD